VCTPCSLSLRKIEAYELLALYAISGIGRANVCHLWSSFYMKEADKIKLAVIEIVGMGKGLQFTFGNRFSIALLVFFIPYFLFEIPSNIVMRKVGTARWLSFLALVGEWLYLARDLPTTGRSLSARES
jgi:hypothetical protein